MKKCLILTGLFLSIFVPTSFLLAGESTDSVVFTRAAPASTALPAIGDGSKKISVLANFSINYMGLSSHPGKNHNSNVNNRNWGLGIRYDLNDKFYLGAAYMRNTKRGDMETLGIGYDHELWRKKAWAISLGGELSGLSYKIPARIGDDGAEIPEKRVGGMLFNFTQSVSYENWSLVFREVPSWRKKLGISVVNVSINHRWVC